VDNIVNDLDVDFVDQIVAGNVNDDENNVVGGDPVHDHFFVNVGVDPVIRLNQTGMSYYFFLAIASFDIVNLQNIIKYSVDLCSFFLLDPMILHDRTIGICC